MLVSICVGVIRYYFVILADIRILVIGCIQIFVGCRLISIIIVDSICLLLYWLCSIRCILFVISLLLYHNKWINFILHSDAIVPKSPILSYLSILFPLKLLPFLPFILFILFILFSFKFISFLFRYIVLVGIF